MSTKKTRRSAAAKGTPASGSSKKKARQRGTADGQAKTSGFPPHLVKDDFVRVPRSVLYAGRYIDKSHLVTNPRHRMLLLNLVARDFKGAPIRAFWEELGTDLGVSGETVRKWARELKTKKLLVIKTHTGPVRDPERGRPGYRNDRNTFDLRPFYRVVEQQIKLERDEQRIKKASRRRKDGAE